jgi:ferric-dicitrate binding protein FerR (iron transport regulator)
MTGQTRSTTAKLSLAAALVAYAISTPLAHAGDPRMTPEEAAATAKTVAGRVSVLRDLREWAVEVGDKVKVQETIVTGKDGHALFIVSDGSTFEVFPNAKVTFRKNSGDWRDLLDVMLGRVRVQIEHIGNTPNPNKVLTPTAVISVRGTIFDITVNDANESTLVEVEQGVVDVGHALLGSANKVTLHAGDSVTVYKDEPIAKGKIDKGNLAKILMRAGMEAANVALRQAGAGGTTGTLGGGPSGGIGGGAVGDHGPTGGTTGGTGGTTTTPPATGPTLPSTGPSLPSSGGGLPSLP